MSSGRAVGLLLGVAADAVLGDPKRGHPVAAFGRIAQRVESVTYRADRSAGVLHTAALVGATVGLGALSQRMVRRSPVAEATLTALATWSALGGASLAREGSAMAGHLDSGELAAARSRLRGLCGRRADELDNQGLARATVESVAENTSDAVIAPLFWGALAGVPGLVGYRATNTLDAMIGNRSSRYHAFGWAAARLDDLLNLLPARTTAMLTVACAPVVGGSARESGRIRRRDASAHPSPNAGQVEAAFAGALRIRLGGRIDYEHTAETRPVLGEGRTADGGDITRSVELSRLIGTVGGVLASVTALLVGRRR
ncbi:adenosylcobinamide-phosphate synthase [Actinopolyspora mzabensis]|uniref:Cobalamin biosynthesis protein CobD n=1 Tax=Actinopolyspora mzabensis TaxID=995066 RepID=A0A1G9DZT0_ACTMZ|nr:cobalamin biosynthesis protein [Actinopolyspora mzabensis]SDK69365.1 adenosylcobinamide-phosphate synthase [Actinopolyspora mzabensis]